MTKHLPTIGGYGTIWVTLLLFFKDNTTKKKQIKNEKI